MTTNKWTDIEPQIREVIDKMKQHNQSLLPRMLGLGTLISVLLMILLVRLFGGFGIILALVAGFGSIFYYYYHQRNKEYKAQVVPKMVEAICPGATYSPQGTFDKNIIRASRLYDVSWGEHYKNEDTIRGKVDKTDFVYSEVTLSHTQSNGKTSYEVIDFQGFVFEADFNKHFPGTTIVTSHRFTLTGNFNGLFSDMKRCHLEDVDFEHAYCTYATNDQEARYILSPALQQRILNMHHQFCTQLGDKELSISFHEGRMLIMVPSKKDRFEVKSDIEGVKQDFLALALMIDIVEQLNLNLRIWTKE